MSGTCGTVAKRMNETDLMVFGGRYQTSYLRENIGPIRGTWIKLFCQEIGQYASCLLATSFSPGKKLHVCVGGKECERG